MNQMNDNNYTKVALAIIDRAAETLIKDPGAESIKFNCHEGTPADTYKKVCYALMCPITCTSWGGVRSYTLFNKCVIANGCGELYFNKALDSDKLVAEMTEYKETILMA